MGRVGASRGFVWLKIQEGTFVRIEKLSFWESPVKIRDVAGTPNLCTYIPMVKYVPQKMSFFYYLDNSECTPYWNVWWVLSAQSLCKILYITIVPQLLHIYWWTIFISCHNGIFCVWAIEHIFLIQCLKWWRHMLLLKISWKKPKNNSLFQIISQSLSHRDSGHFSFELTLWEYYEFKTE